MIRSLFLLLAVFITLLPASASAKKNNSENLNDQKVNTISEKGSDGMIDPKEKKPMKKTKKMKTKEMKDHFIDQKEIDMMKNRRKVITENEKRFDADGNGWLNRSEQDELLKAKLTTAREKGQAKIDSPVESKYDKNSDGYLSPDEAKEMINEEGLREY